MTFVAHSLVLIDGPGRQYRTRHDQLAYLTRMGFEVVQHIVLYRDMLETEIENFTRDVETFPYPVDGLVLALDDLKYGEALGATAKYPKHSMAFKWADTTILTKVTGMKWSVSQTGLITPVVLFEHVPLEGTIVKQANLHSLRIFEEFGIGIGDIIKVYKQNKIIPTLDENFTRSGTETYPEQCPKCGGPTTVVRSEKTSKLHCYACAKN